MLILEKVMAGNIITTNLCDRSDWHLDDCVNKVVIENMVKEDIAFIFATGKYYYEEFTKSIEYLNLKPYQQVVPYLEDMANALAASDLVIGSAGAISLAEITALGKPSIIIPKAYTAENHQEYNAKSIESKGAGIAILEKDLTPKTLNETVFRLLGDRELLIDMENASKKIGKPEAIDLICDEIIKIYEEKNKVKKSNIEDKNTDIKEDDEKESSVDNNNDSKEQPKVIGIKKK